MFVCLFLLTARGQAWPWPGLISGCHCLFSIELLLRFIDISWRLGSFVFRITTKGNQFLFGIEGGDEVLMKPCIIKASIFIWGIFYSNLWWRENDDWILFWGLINILLHGSNCDFIIHLVIEVGFSIINWFNWKTAPRTECKINRETIAFWRASACRKVINSTRHEIV